SRSTMCLSASVYAACSAKKLQRSRMDAIPSGAANRAAETRSSAATASAARAESSPRAIGRARLTGCTRSCSASRTSLTREHALEAAALAGLRRQLDPSTQSDRELVRDCQAEPRPRIVPRPEGPEDPFLFLRRDARTVVVDRDCDATVGGAQLELDVPAVRGP